MLSLFACNGLSLEGDVLKKSVGGHRWDTHALFTVADPESFLFSAKPLRDDEYFIGIVDKAVDLTLEDIEKRDGVFIMLEADQKRQYVLCAGKKHHMTLPGVEEYFKSCRGDGPPLATVMKYEKGRVYFGVDGFSCVAAPIKVPPGDYRPCASIGPSTAKVHISLQSPIQRQRSDESFAKKSSKIMRSLWEDRSFSDATIVCGNVFIPVHRCVLCKSASFFERAFEGSMREAGEAKITIEDADENAVKEMLCYLYTGNVSSNADHTSVLPLAHRLDIESLVELSAVAIVDQLSPSNVAQSVASLRKFRDSKNVKAHWERAMTRIKNEGALVESLALAY
eukprot:TRINITY_DN20298_c0_g1_i1.p1 TRINITY_DN20298_c0_g1~~TRINITY_DN20298_c0_g1_i1.p1  ORF type:complete len:338 (-),score=45.16 TRINITY_DN20298_c0_g1_i1:141-1154(-)